MSTPHIAWAFAQRNLTAAQRVVLIALAERANGERTCFPSEETLACDCELSRRSVIAAVQYLRDDRGLIEVVTDPEERASILAKAGARKTARVNVYRILRPADGAKSAHTNGAKSAPPKATNGAKSAHTHAESEKSARLAGHEGAKSASRECKKQQIERAPFAHEPLNESLQEEKRAVLSPEKEGGTPPPDAVAEAKSFMSRVLGRPVPLEVETPETVTEDDVPKTPEDRARMAAQLAALAQQLAQSKRHFAIPRGPRFTVNEHREVAAGMERTAEPTIPRGLEAVIAAHRANVRANVQPDA